MRFSCTQKGDGGKEKNDALVEMKRHSVVGCNTCGLVFIGVRCGTSDRPQASTRIDSLEPNAGM
jgi:hypothetical protein